MKGLLTACCALLAGLLCCGPAASENTVWEVMQTGTAGALYGLWGSSAADVLAVGDQGTILHYYGSSWSTHTKKTSSALYAVWGAAADDVYAVGAEKTVLHFTG